MWIQAWGRWEKGGARHLKWKHSSCLSVGQQMRSKGRKEPGEKSGDEADLREIILLQITRQILFHPLLWYEWICQACVYCIHQWRHGRLIMCWWLRISAFILLRGKVLVLGKVIYKWNFGRWRKRVFFSFGLPEGLIHWDHKQRMLNCMFSCCVWSTWSFGKDPSRC